MTHWLVLVPGVTAPIHTRAESRADALRDALYTLGLTFAPNGTQVVAVADQPTQGAIP